MKGWKEEETEKNVAYNSISMRKDDVFEWYITIVSNMHCMCLMSPKMMQEYFFRTVVE